MYGALKNEFNKLELNFDDMVVHRTNYTTFSATTVYNESSVDLSNIIILDKKPKRRKK